MFQHRRFRVGTRLRQLAVIGVFMALFSAASCGGDDAVRSSSADESATATSSATAAVASESPRKPSPTPTPTPVVTTEVVTETEPIPFERVTKEDPTLPTGTSEVSVAGVEGVRTFTYEVELTDGVETARTLIDEKVTTKPVAEVTVVGTYEEPEPEPEPDPEPDGSCDPNYSGCVPIDSDVDCAGGSGNGPSYVDGPVTVTGTDIYGLDSDGDGVGCES